jgi:hypothetical protein
VVACGISQPKIVDAKDMGPKMHKKDFAKLLQGLANAKAHAEGDLRKARRVSVVEVPQATPGRDVDYSQLSKYSF